MTQREARRIAKWHSALVLKSARAAGWPFNDERDWSAEDKDRINEELDRLVDKLELQSMRFVTSHAEELQEGGIQ